LETDQDSQEALRFAYRSGHQIASHTLSHKDLTAISGAEFDEEVDGLANIIQKLIGVT
jgi:peptidoglycan/xylan/chitin deacetylase (PgdA/CDA1 family)